MTQEKKRNIGVRLYVTEVSGGELNAVEAVPMEQKTGYGFRYGNSKYSIRLF